MLDKAQRLTATTELVLEGLDGSNPLGFLAALGALRASGGDARLAWRSDVRPVLHTHDAGDRAALCRRIAAALRRAQGLLDEYPSQIVKTSAKDFRAFASGPDELGHAFAASFGSDGARDESDEDLIAPTRLSLANGNGGKKLVLQFRTMVASAPDVPDEPPRDKKQRRRGNKTAAACLHQLIDEALFEWKARDGGGFYSFRWDPAELRRHAHVAVRPEDDKYRPVPGANLLAVLGLTLLPSAPAADGLVTTCLFEHAGRELFAWPLWEARLSADQVLALLVSAGSTGRDVFAPGWNASVGVIARFAVERYSDAQKNAYFNTSFAI